MRSACGVRKLLVGRIAEGSDLSVAKAGAGPMTNTMRYPHALEAGRCIAKRPRQKAKQQLPLGSPFRRKSAGTGPFPSAMSDAVSSSDTRKVFIIEGSRVAPSCGAVCGVAALPLEERRISVD